MGQTTKISRESSIVLRATLDFDLRSFTLEIRKIFQLHLLLDNWKTAPNRCRWHFCCLVCPSICSSDHHPSVCLFIRLYICLSVYSHVCLSSHMCVCLSVVISTSRKRQTWPSPLFSWRSKVTIEHHSDWQKNGGRSCAYVSSQRHIRSVQRHRDVDGFDYVADDSRENGDKHCADSDGNCSTWNHRWWDWHSSVGTATGVQSAEILFTKFNIRLFNPRTEI